MNHFHHVAIQCTQNEGEQGRNNAKGQVACGGIHMRDCDHSWQTDDLSSFPEKPNRRNAADSASHLKFTALPRPQPAAIIATVILLCGAMSDLLSSDVAMRMSMGDEWLQATWDTCKASNRCRPPPFSPQCRA